MGLRAARLPVRHSSLAYPWVYAERSSLAQYGSNLEHEQLASSPREERQACLYSAAFSFGCDSSIIILIACASRHAEYFRLRIDPSSVHYFYPLHSRAANLPPRFALSISRYAWIYPVPITCLLKTKLNNKKHKHYLKKSKLRFFRFFLAQTKRGQKSKCGP